MEQLAIVLVFALALVVLLRRPGFFQPALVADGPWRWPGPRAPGDEDEQQPETDRAPRPWLPWTIAAVAVVRVAVLVTLHA